MMLRGLWKLTWIEIKIFLREPLGAFGTIGIPVLVFLVSRSDRRPQRPTGFTRRQQLLSTVGLPVLASVLIAISAVLSLVTIISIYREGGILKRLRATPLRPQTILTAHVLVKLLLTAATLALMVFAGKRYYPIGIHVPSVRLYDGASDQHLQHPVDRFSHRQHRPHGALCATHRRHHHVSDDRGLGTFVPVTSLPPAAPARGQSYATHLHGVTARWDLEGRSLVGSRRRCCGSGCSFHRVHGAFGEGISLGVARFLHCALRSTADVAIRRR